jgi:tRNA-modifying protein YgfZ
MLCQSSENPQSTIHNRMTDLRSILQAAHTGSAIYDSSDWGKILVSDRDRLRFLHNQSTADFERLKPGESCDTVFVTSTARTIDLATGLVLDDEVLLIVSPNRRKYLFDWLDRYIFFADKVRLNDVTDRTASFTLMGGESDRILTQLGCENLQELPLNSHRLVTIDNLEIRIVNGTELGLPGYRLICDRQVGEIFRQKILDLGAAIVDETVWEHLRIDRGRPKPDAELTEDYNPLEVGLWQTISFAKGCYIGQETIARLNTYKGVKQYLWGIKLAAPVAVGTPLTIDGEKVGIVTSTSDCDGKVLGLAYVKSKAGGVGSNVLAGDVEGEIIDLPFITHDYPQLT